MSSPAEWSHPDSCKYIAEFTGTFFLVLTVGCNVLTGSIGAALSIGSMLMVMVFAVGTVSGAHFNPAVTFAICLSQRGVISAPHALMYIASQLAGGLAAGAVYAIVCGGTFTLEPVGMHTQTTVCVVEALYTMALCYVVLNVATTRKQDGNHYFGLAIGFTVVAAAIAIGGISGCSLNPAVTFGIQATRAFGHGMKALSYFPLYFFSPFLGSVLACVSFYVVRKHDEYHSDEKGK